MRREHRAALLLLAASWALAHIVLVLMPGVFQAWNEQLIDRLLAYRATSARWRPAYDDRVVHVDINNASLRTIGSFYLDRAQMARGLQSLGRVGVAAQVYDFVFAQPQAPAGDAALIDATREAGHVYYGIAFRLADGRPTPPGEDAAVARYLASTSWQIPLDGQARELREGVSPLATFPALAAAAAGLGSLTIQPDADGVIRRMPLVLRYGPAFYPSVPLRVICDYLGVVPAHVRLRPGRTLELERPDGHVLRIPIDARGDVRVNFIGGWDRMKHYDFGDLYRAAEDRDELDLMRADLERRIAVVADVSANSRDVGPVPTDREYPLSGLLATVMHSMLTESFLREVSATELAGIEFLLLLVVFGAAVRLRPVPFALAIVGLTTGFVVMSVGAFLWWQVIVPVVGPLLLLSFAVTSNVGHRYMVEERDKAFLRRTFEAYFPPKVVRRLMADPSLITSPGERKELSILFSDIAGFTKRSEHLPPDHIQAFLNEYFEAMIEIVFRYDGTVDKFIGDGLMVFCGDPEPQPDHAVRTVKMALDMQEAVRAMSRRWQARGDPPLDVRIGINTGVVVVGNMGSTKRLSYTVLGADVNLAQRLESHAPTGGILISRRTHDLLAGAVPTRPAGRITVKGFEAPIEVFVVTEGPVSAD